MSLSYGAPWPAPRRAKNSRGRPSRFLRPWHASSLGLLEALACLELRHALGLGALSQRRARPVKAIGMLHSAGHPPPSIRAAPQMIDFKPAMACRFEPANGRTRRALIGGLKKCWWPSWR